MKNTVVFGLIITFVLIFLGYCYPKSKKLFNIQLIFMWIMLSFNIGGVDYNVHLSIFNSKTLNLDFFNSPLYLYLCYFFRVRGFTFFTFNFIINTACLLLLKNIISKSTKNTSLVMSFLLIYPFVENIIQKRFFCGLCFASYGLFLLMKKDKKYGLFSLLFILIGSLLHQGVFFVFLLYVLQLVDYKKIKKIFWFVIISAFLLLPYIPKIAGIFFPASKVQLYFYALKSSTLDAICWMFLHIIFVILIYLFKKNIIVEESNFDKEIYKLNINSLILLPLYYYEPTFIRIFRIVLLFDYIYIANKMEIVKGFKNLVKNQVILVICWVVYLIMVYLMIYVITGSGFKALVVPEFDNNLVLRYLFGGK